MTRTEVIIVGAGPVGLAVALGLGRQGIHTIVLDSDPEPPQPVTPGLAQELQDIVERRVLGNAASSLRPHAVYTGPVLVRSAQGETEVLHLPIDTDAVMASTLPDLDGQCLRAALLEALSAYPQVEVLWDHQVRELGQRESEARVLVQTDEGDRVIEADCIIGADGVHSTVRRTLGTRWETLDGQHADGERLLQFTVKAPLAHAGLQPLNFACDPVNWAVISQGACDGEWQIICSVADTQGSASSRAERRFAALFSDYANGAVVVHANTLIAHHRAAERYQVGKIVLVGDAAYEIPVWTGLGLATGLDDARYLAQALGQMLRENAEPDAMERLNAERKAGHSGVIAPQVSQLQALLMSDEWRPEQWRSALEMALGN